VFVNVRRERDRFGAFVVVSIVCTRFGASRISSAINDVSGNVAQYRFGISFCMARIFTRAGLKIAA